MILYHGTDSKNLASILARGLLPRKDTGNQVYHGDFASRDDFVYLTNYNPVAHAYSIDENSPVIFQVDVREEDLYPDEDFLERAHYLTTGELGVAAGIDISKYKHLWEESLKLFGCVATRKVEAKDILGHVVLDGAHFELHCGLGAQGNTNKSKDPTRLTFAENASVYMRRLHLLFEKGWEEVKKDILKDKPSVVMELAPKQWVLFNGIKYGVLVEPREGVYLLDEWQENVPSEIFEPRGAVFTQTTKRSQ
jgi:hypothetical protein